MKTDTRSRLPVLLPFRVYSGDNGQLICTQCAGQTALFTGRDLSGRKLVPMTDADAIHWGQVMGEPLACECGKTTHVPPGGTPDFDAKAAGKFFGCTPAAAAEQHAALHRIKARTKANSAEVSR